MSQKKKDKERRNERRGGNLMEWIYVSWGIATKAGGIKVSDGRDDCCIDYRTGMHSNRLPSYRMRTNVCCWRICILRQISTHTYTHRHSVLLFVPCTKYLRHLVLALIIHSKFKCSNSSINSAVKVTHTHTHTPCDITESYRPLDRDQK